jgi:outer membrane lipoprotein-sorting protein
MKNFKFELFILMLLCSLAASPERPGSAQETSKAEALVKKTINAYRELTSYQDTGTLEVTTNLGATQRTTAKPISFSFKRPDFLRFEWMESTLSEAQGSGVLTTGKKKTSFYLGILNQYTNSLDLSAGLGAATGASSGLVFTLPSLLLKDIPVAPIEQLTNLRLLQSEVVADTQCYVITGELRTGVGYKLWVGYNDFLIRQIEQVIQPDLEAIKELELASKEAGVKLAPETLASLQNGTFITRETHREIKINHQIADAVFQFTPPRGATLNKDMLNFKKNN